MNKSVLLLPLLALNLATGCANPEGVWYFEFGEVEVVDQDSDCSENMSEADCPTSTTSTSDWDYDLDGERSVSAAFGEIVDGPGGRSYLVLGNEIYTGDKVGGGYVFEWEHFDRSEENSSHDSGYEINRESDSTSLTRLVLDRQGSTLVGTIETETTIDTMWTETDRWMADGTAPYYGEIGSKIYLEGDDSNTAESSDCTSDPCRVESESTSVTNTPVTAWQTGAESDAFDGLSGANQTPGVDLE